MKLQMFVWRLLKNPFNLIFYESVHSVQKSEENYQPPRYFELLFVTKNSYELSLGSYSVVLHVHMYINIYCWTS
jgi:hypothetical protein